MKYLRPFLPVKNLTFSACFALGAALTFSSHAGIIDWDGDTSTAWATNNNWVGGLAPANDITSDIARFNLATYGGNPVFAPNAGTTSIAGIQIGASNGAMTLATTNLSIGASGITMEANAAAATIGRITAAVDQTWTNNSVNALTFSGANVYTGRVTLAGTGTINLSANIHSGAGGVTIDGAAVVANQTTTQTGIGLLELRSGSLSVNANRGWANDLSITGNFTFNAASTGPSFTSATKSTTGNVALNFVPITTTAANTGVGFTTGAIVLGGNLEILASPGGDNGLRLINRNFTSGFSMGGANRTITLSESGGSGTTTIGLLTLDGNLTIAGTGSTTATLNGGFNTSGVNRTITFDKSGTGVATLSGAITGTASTLTIAGSSTSSIIGALTGGTAHAINVNSNTGGSFTFNGQSTFSGGVTVTSGTVLPGSASGIASTSGHFGTGALIINGGIVQTSAAGTGSALLASSSITVNGGELRGTRGAALTNGGGGITLNGGTIRGLIAGTTDLGGGAYNVTATSSLINERTAPGNGLTITYGTSLAVGSSQLNVTSTDSFNAGTPTSAFASGTLTGSAILNVTNNPSGLAITRLLYNTTLGVTGAGNSIAAGNGRVEVTGLTTVNGGGTLLVNGNLTATGGVTVAAAGTLGGSGTTTGAVTTSNTTSVITPGSSGAGTMSVTGAVNADLGANFKFDLGATSGGGVSDLLAMTGIFTGSTAANGLIFDFTNIGTTAATPYTLLTFASSTGLARSDIQVNTAPSGFMLDSSFGSNGFLINGTDLQVQFTVVPEPSTYALLVVGLGLAIWVRRRGRKSEMPASV